MSNKITFKEFAIFVQVGKIDDAAMALSVILDLDDDVAETATQFFVKKLKTDSQMFAKLMSLRIEIEQSENSAMATLIDCFGFSGPQLLAVIQSLKDIVKN